MTRKRPVSVVITRSQEENEKLARRLRRAGLEPVPVDTISFAPPDSWDEVDRALRDLASFDWLAFTSSSGVEYFGRRAKSLSLELPWKGKPKVAAVGEHTATALSGLGLKADFVPSRFTTENLGEELPGRAGDRVLLLRSEEANPVLEAKLGERGFRVQETAVYRTLPVRRSNIKIKKADMIVFASPSAVRSFCSLVTEEELREMRRLRTICIGPVTESAAREMGFVNTSVPETFTIDAVVDEIGRLSQSHA